MPELPEVENIARAFDSGISGATCKSIRFFRPDIRRPIPQALVRQVLGGQKIKTTWRRGKYLLIQTARGHGIIHLGMSGKLLLLPEKTPQHRHTHAVFSLEFDRDNAAEYIHYIDPRRFGSISAVLGAAESHPLIAKLGVEPLATPELGLELHDFGHKSRRSIKSLIMDASIIVGVGNIYALEALFLAKIHPEAVCSSLAKHQYKKLGEAIVEVLEKAIKAGGTSFRDYRQLDGQKGNFALHLNVYGRTGKDCRTCQSIVTLIKQGGRSTWYCPRCQQLATSPTKNDHTHRQNDSL